MGELVLKKEKEKRTGKAGRREETVFFCYPGTDRQGNSQKVCQKLSWYPLECAFPFIKYGGNVPYLFYHVSAVY